jgi:hypothetical protein
VPAYGFPERDWQHGAADTLMNGMELIQERVRKGPLCCVDVPGVFRKLWPPVIQQLHPIAMLTATERDPRTEMRTPAEPSPPPVKEPPDPPEGPDTFPIREPDPEEPDTI